MTTAASESGPAGQTPPPRPASLRWPLDQGGWNPVPTASPGENLIETADVRGTVELEYSVPPGCQAGERPVEFAWLIHEWIGVRPPETRSAAIEPVTTDCDSAEHHRLARHQRNPNLRTDRPRPDWHQPALWPRPTLPFDPIRCESTPGAPTGFNSHQKKPF